MRKLLPFIALFLLFASCGQQEPEVTVEWFLKTGSSATPEAISRPDSGLFQGSQELKKAWEADTKFTKPITTPVAGGYVISEGAASIFLDGKTGKPQELPKNLVSGATDGKTVWGNNGYAWSVKDRKPVWKNPLKVEPESFFAIADGCLLLVSPKSVSRINQQTGENMWTLELSVGTISQWAVTDSFLFVVSSNWVFRMSPLDGQYAFISKHSSVHELIGSGKRFVTLADDKMSVFEEQYSTPILTMGESNKKIEYIWLSNDSMLILTGTGYHFGKLPTDLKEETKHTFKSFTYNAKDNKMLAFTHVVGLGDNFAVVQGNLVACIGPDAKRDIWFFQLPAPDEKDVLPRIHSLSKDGVMIFYKGKASLWR